MAALFFPQNRKGGLPHAEKTTDHPCRMQRRIGACAEAATAISKPGEDADTEVER